MLRKGFFLFFLTLIAVSAGFYQQVTAQPPTNCANVTEIPQAECEALLDFYASTNGTTWVNNTGWGLGNAPCSWHGVVCDGGHVTGLTLLDNRVSGVLPETIGNLSQLTNIDLTSNINVPETRNTIGGRLPASLFTLTNLTKLRLGGTNVRGNLPPEIANLVSLDNELNTAHVLHNMEQRIYGDDSGKHRRGDSAPNR